VNLSNILELFIWVLFETYIGTLRISCSLKADLEFVIFDVEADYTLCKIKVSYY